MMQTAESLVSKHAIPSHGTNPVVGRSLPESKMRSILVVVVNILVEQSCQMTFVDCDDVIQQIAAAAGYPTLRYTILPRTPE